MSPCICQSFPEWSSPWLGCERALLSSPALTNGITVFFPLSLPWLLLLPLCLNGDADLSQQLVSGHASSGSALESMLSCTMLVCGSAVTPQSRQIIVLCKLPHVEVCMCQEQDIHSSDKKDNSSGRSCKIFFHQHHPRPLKLTISHQCALGYLPSWSFHPWSLSESSQVSPSNLVHVLFYQLC